jgi:4-alpha-glucanotransferase
MDPELKEKFSKCRAKSQWKRMGFHDRHGFALMLSSLHSKSSCQIGEFLDLIPLIKWAKRVGFSFIQLLPINDTGKDNSPYNPLSTFALNPIYLSLSKLPFLHRFEDLQFEILELQNASPGKEVDYQKVRRKKLSFFCKYLEKTAVLIKKQKAYQNFLKQQSWVKEYALYNTYSEIYLTYDWTKWPQKIQKLSSKEKSHEHKKHHLRVDFYTILQYLSFQQMKQVKKEADKIDFKLMGDLPFLVSAQSSDVWDNQKLFDMSMTVGSPPDAFTPRGQNWQFPAYNWDEMIASNYSWWKKRLKVSELFYQIYRIDHIVGFFRTWNIPQGKSAKTGCFIPQDPALWTKRGRDFLTMLVDNTSMFPIGEDLAIPQVFRDTIRDLGIAGTRIMSWERIWGGTDNFVPLPLYTEASITTIASHDTETLEQWWRQYPKEAQAFSRYKKWKYQNHLDYRRRFEILKDCHQTSSVFHACLLNEYLALFPDLVHSNYNQERVNYPGTPSKKNWRYRFIPSVEEIIDHKKLLTTLKKLI